MEQVQAAPKGRKKLPAWAGWLVGYVATLLAAAGLVYYWRVIFSPMAGGVALPLTLGAMGLASLLYLVLFAICRLKGDTLCLRAALLIFVLGLLFCFATAPLQVPDEDRHFLRAYAISMGHFTYDGAEDYPEDVDLLVQHFPPAYNHKMTNQHLPMPTGALAEYRAALDAGKTAAQPAGAPIMFQLIPFLLQALFMAVARLFGVSALGMLYAGRIANLLVYALICFAAFRNCQRYRGIFFAIALLPLSLFMAASCSYDCIMLACCFLLVSFFCKDEIFTRDLVVFCLALALVTYIKPHNVVLAALLLLIPKARWKSRFNPWLVTAGIAVAGLVVWYGMGFVDGSVLKHGYPAELPRGSGEAADVQGQIGFILQNLPATLARMLFSVYENAGFLFSLGTFGWVDLSLPLVSGLSVLGLATAAALGIQQKEDTPTGAAVGLGLAGLLYSAAIMAGMYVADTDVGSIRVTGAQPRYFLPAFLLLFMLASILLGRAVRPRLKPGGGTLARTESITLWIVAGIALVSAIWLFQNTYIGQWLPKADGGWKMVNLFGWQVYASG